MARPGSGHAANLASACAAVAAMRPFGLTRWPLQSQAVEVDCCVPSNVGTVLSSP